jgi:rare lipoprotein A (peptidoglycan hydrolase)
MFRIGRQALPLAFSVIALTLVTSACQAVLEPRPAALAQPGELHPIPPPSRAQAAAAARRAAAIPDLAPGPPAAALATVEATRARAERPVLETGTASWYGPGFAGRPTASGEIFDPLDMTAAHPELPLGTEVVVVNLANGREARLRINDRGPFIGDRVIDVSKAAAKALGFYYTGLAEVRVELALPVAVAASRADA